MPSSHVRLLSLEAIEENSTRVNLTNALGNPAHMVIHANIKLLRAYFDSRGVEKLENLIPGLHSTELEFLKTGFDPAYLEEVSRI